MAKIPRLSELNIEDDVLRGVFYGRVMDYINDPESPYMSVTIRPNEEYRPDLVSYRVYGTVELRWLVGLMCAISDEAEPLPVGESFKFPDSLWIRQAMRQFLDDMGL
ncbi:hypothetical protein [Photobacterium leiognathi]|uniref:hypothetical protein n=1 Tax=Photobacterium leiognathi TaxID=553611 RepID=UPI002980AD40|nr:hypothetical protein [Photobacterium leiognathi]